MKKAIALLILLSIIASVFTGCALFPTNSNNGSNHENGNADIDKVSVVRLLLAEESLNAALLKNKDNIFENGASVMNTLAVKTLASVDYLNGYKIETATVKTLGGTDDYSDLIDFTSSTEQTIFDNNHGGGKVTFDGENYIFSDFVEVSNSYDAFSATANHIAQLAEDAAELIDNIKKNVRIVDKWVVMPDGTEYYLHVGANEEMLCERTPYNYKICKRYINKDGNNVYEFLSYDFTRGFTDRLTYIPGLHFETARGEYVNGSIEGSDNLICDNTKGYWEAYWVSPHPTHVNVSYTVMKDDICYDSFYDPAEKKINFLKIISDDKTSDIFWYQGDESAETVEFNIHFSGFNNVAGVLSEKIEMIEMGGEIGSVPMPADYEKLTLLLKNGKTIKVGDTFVGGKVQVSFIRVEMTYPGYIGSVTVNISAPTVEEKLELFKAFLNEAGFTSRHDINEVISGVNRAFDELREITKYHVWNGLNQSTEENVRRAIAIESEKTVDFLKIYDTIKDAQTINFSDMEAVELNAHFAKTDIIAYRDTVHSGLELSVGSLTLSVSDTFLFVEGQAYTVNFALASNAGLVHLEKKLGSGMASYANEDTFSVTVENVKLDIPTLADGECTLVAYISTDDGVRSSDYTAVKFDVVDTENEFVIEKTRLTVSKAESGAIILLYTVIADVYTELSFEGNLDYEGLYTLMAGIACEYGIPENGNLEMLTDARNDVYTSMTGSEAEVVSGVYRMAYNMQNAEKTASGYVYVTLTISSAEQE